MLHTWVTGDQQQVAWFGDIFDQTGSEVRFSVPPIYMSKCPTLRRCVRNVAEHDVQIVKDFGDIFDQSSKNHDFIC